MEVPIPDGLAPLAFLLGRWRGEGWGTYSTIEDFTYAEEIEFEHRGKPFLIYGQKTRRIGGEAGVGEALHTESGYWRPSGPGLLEVVIAQPTGVVEVHSGSIDGTSILLHTIMVGVTPTAKSVTAVERRLSVDGDELRYELWMEAVGRPHQPHLEAILRRVPR